MFPHGFFIVHTILTVLSVISETTEKSVNLALFLK